MKKPRLPSGRTFKIFGLVFMVLFLFYLFFLNYTEPTQVGIARNRVTGNMWLQEGGGWYISWPWVGVVRIDTRPVRVSVPSAGRGYSAKLVQFNAQAWRQFVDTEGFHYYWWANRFSYNFGYKEEHRGMKDLLRGYAYGMKPYDFILVLQEWAEN